MQNIAARRAPPNLIAQTRKSASLLAETCTHERATRRGATTRNPSVKRPPGAEATLPSHHAQHVVSTRRVFWSAPPHATHGGRWGRNFTDGSRTTTFPISAILTGVK